MELGAGKIRSPQEVYVKVVLPWCREHWSEGYRLHRITEVFTDALTFWLMCASRMRGDATLRGMLQILRSGEADEIIANSKASRSRVLREGSVSQFTGGLSKACNRMEEEKAKALVDALTDALIADGRKHKDEQRAFYVDGLCVTLEHTEEILRLYPTTKSEGRQEHNPILRTLFAHDVKTGVALRPEWGPYRGAKARSEQSLSRALFERLPAHSLIIGDRNFGVFSVLYYAHSNGHQVLTRLTSNRAKLFLKGRKGEELIDEAACWTPTESDCEKHPEYTPGISISGRFIRVVLKANGFRPETFYFFTTSEKSREQLLELYRRRQDIETDFRSLKHIFGINLLYSKSPQMVSKELVAAVAAYNLIRAVVGHGANQIKIPPRQISFSAAARLVPVFGSQLLAAKSKAQRGKIWSQFLTALRQIKLPTRRTQRVEPRKIARNKRVFDRYPSITTSREEEREKILQSRQDSAEDQELS